MPAPVVEPNARAVAVIDSGAAGGLPIRRRRRSNRRCSPVQTASVLGADGVVKKVTSPWLRQLFHRLKSATLPANPLPTWTIC